MFDDDNDGNGGDAGTDRNECSGCAVSANDRVALYVVVHICTESTPSRCRSD